MGRSGGAGLSSSRFETAVYQSARVSLYLYISFPILGIPSKFCMPSFVQIMFKKSEVVKVWAIFSCGSQAHLHPVVYGRQSCPMDTRLWGLARCGHHAFADGRSARQRHASPDVPCRFLPSDETRLNRLSLVALRIANRVNVGISQPRAQCPLPSTPCSALIQK